LSSAPSASKELPMPVSTRVPPDRASSWIRAIPEACVFNPSAARTMASGCSQISARNGSSPGREVTWFMACSFLLFDRTRGYAFDEAPLQDEEDHDHREDGDH